MSSKSEYEIMDEADGQSRSMSARCENIRVLIVDDDALTREGLKVGLSSDEAFIIHEACSGLDAIRYFKDEPRDVVLLDLKMPSLDGMDTMRVLKDIDGRVPVVMLTAYGDIPSAVEAMKCGAYDFTVKPPKLDELIATLKRAVQTSEHRDRIAGKTLANDTAPQPEQFKTLTSREREIFSLTVRGFSSTQIADRLSISPRTVESHRENIREKLGARNNADLIRFAMRHRILT